MTYLQLTNQECEYVSLSRDTTESDLKQRREILNGTSVYIDQAAVRAAINSRILVIDGIEKAERNILPILNNLLENREMHLEDGRFLVSAERYDDLLKTHSEEELIQMGLVRVGSNFRVMALGLPVPKYRGSALDPPLRSRFQSREISNLSYHEILNSLRFECPKAPEKSLQKILSFGFGIASSDSVSTLPEFPLDNFVEAGKILENNPQMSPYEVIKRLYPLNSILTEAQRNSVDTLLKSLSIEVPSKESKQKISEIQHHADHAKVKITRPGWISSSKVVFDVPISQIKSTNIESNEKFVNVESQSNLLVDLLQTYAVGDFCIIGSRGSGKSAIVMELCRLLNQPFEQVTLYKVNNFLFKKKLLIN